MKTHEIETKTVRCSHRKSCDRVKYNSEGCDHEKPHEYDEERCGTKCIDPLGCRKAKCLNAKGK